MKERKKADSQWGERPCERGEEKLDPETFGVKEERPRRSVGRSVGLSSVDLEKKWPEKWN